MAEIASFQFDLREVTEALVKQQGLHEGRWMLGINFNYAAGNFGPDETETQPGALVRIAAMNLRRVSEAELELPFIVDAAQVNPRRPKTRRKKAA